MTQETTLTLDVRLHIQLLKVKATSRDVTDYITTRLEPVTDIFL